MAKAQLCINGYDFSYTDTQGKICTDLYSITNKLAKYKSGSIIDIKRTDVGVGSLQACYYIIFNDDKTVSLVYVYLENRTLQELCRIPRVHLQDTFDYDTVRFWKKFSLFCDRLRVLNLNVDKPQTYTIYKIPYNICGVAENGYFAWTQNNAEMIMKTTLANAWKFIKQNSNKLDKDIRWAICDNNDVIVFLL